MIEDLLGNIPRFMDTLACGLAFLLPDTFHSETAELDGFRRSCGGRADRLLRRRGMPQVSEDGDAAGVDMFYLQPSIMRIGL